MRTLHIVEEPQEYRDGTDLTEVDYLTPKEAVGELVEIEWPGTRGKEIYVIENVDLDKRETKLTKVSSGDTYTADDSILPPSCDHFTRPRIGREVTVKWLEHLNGRNEWVQTTPKISIGRPKTYYGFYEGHEKTRVVEKTYKYIPPAVLEMDIRRSNSDDESYTYFWNKDIEEIEKVYDQIEADKDAGVVGQVYVKYVNSDAEIVWYDIDYEYRSYNYTSPAILLER